MTVFPPWSWVEEHRKLSAYPEQAAPGPGVFDTIGGAAIARIKAESSRHDFMVRLA